MTSDSLELALFPLQAVLFPGGLLNLKVFEARYLDLISTCLRENTPFGVVALRRGTEARQPDQKEEATLFETRGTMCVVADVDSAQSGILQVRCHGTQRFDVTSSRQQPDGLWRAQVRLVDGDEAVLPTDPMIETVRGLANAIATLKQQGTEPFQKPFQFDNAGWVANRWCEILPISLAAKQKLMELPDPAIRLQLVDEFLRTKGVVK
jgi:Lon protease-like protein